MPEPARALVSGGAGFIGSELVSQLAAKGWDVVVIDNLSTGHWENLASVQLPAGQQVTGDIRDAALLPRLMHGVDTVFHLACRGLRFSLHSPRETHEVNAGGTLNMLEAARHAGVRRFLQVSSSEVYGASPTLPMREDGPTRPTTVYGASKLAGEAYARAYHVCNDLPVTIVRPFNSFGPRAHHEGDAGEVIPKFILRALAGQSLTVFGDGLQTRDFCPVADTARGIVLAAITNAALGETLNLGTGTETSMLALARAVIEAVGNSASTIQHDAPRPGDLLRLRACTLKASRILGFQVTTTFDEALTRLIDWYGHDPAQARLKLKHERIRNWEPLHV